MKLFNFAHDRVVGEALNSVVFKKRSKSMKFNFKTISNNEMDEFYVLQKSEKRA